MTLPPQAIGGLITLTLLILTALLQHMSMKGKGPRISLKAHQTLAGLTILFALLHGYMGLRAYL